MEFCVGGLGILLKWWAKCWDISMEFFSVGGPFDALQLCFWVGGDGRKRRIADSRKCSVRDGAPSLVTHGLWPWRLICRSNQFGLKRSHLGHWMGNRLVFVSLKSDCWLSSYLQFREETVSFLDVARLLIISAASTNYLIELNSKDFR